MIFSNIRSSTDVVATLSNIPIQRTSTAKFLGVIVDDNLTWKYHIAALKTKMNRNAGILFKMKGILPLTVLKTLYHCFVQSQLNHCPLVWGMGSKTSLNPLFIAQKRAIRTLIPGFANYFYNKETGDLPCHTKGVFNSNLIPTIHNIILQRLIVFMKQIHGKTALIPMQNLFTIVPSPTCINNRYSIFSCPNARLKPHLNSIFVKGPLLYPSILLEIERSDPHKLHTLQSLLIKPFKNLIKSYTLKTQTEGDENEWHTSNFRLHVGIRHSHRITLSHNI